MPQNQSENNFNSGPNTSNNSGMEVLGKTVQNYPNKYYPNTATNTGPKLPNSAGNPNFPVNQNPYGYNISPEANFQVPGRNTPKSILKNPNKKTFDIKGFLKKWWWAVTAAVLIFAIGVVALLLAMAPKPKVDNSPYNQVEAVLTTSPTSPSGSPTKFVLTIKNNEKVSIEDIIIDLDLDSTFKYIDTISNLTPSKPDGSQYQYSKLNPSGSSGDSLNIQFNGILIGNIDDKATFQGTVSYTPTPLKNQSTNNTRSINIDPINVTIIEPEVKLSIYPTQTTVQNGSESQINVSFENISDKELKDIRLRMAYPSKGSFNYVSSELILDNQPADTTPTQGNNEWNIPILTQNQRQTLVVKGVIYGDNEANLVFQVFVEARQTDGNYIVLSQQASPIKIATQPLDVVTTIIGKETDKRFKPGDTLSFNISYRNSSTTTLKNLEAVASLEDSADLLDYSTIQFIGEREGLSTTEQFFGKVIMSLN
jgi:hypothetical protein